MDQIDVQPELTQATLTPQEASSNIDKAGTMGVSPDAFIDNKELNNNYKLQNSEVKTTMPIAKKLGESRAIASVMKEEVPIWTSIDNSLREIGDAISNKIPDFVKNQNDQSRLNKLYNKGIDEKLTAQEAYDIKRLETKSQRYGKLHPGLNADIGTSEFAEGAGQATLGVILDMGRSIYTQPALSGTLIGGPAAVGFMGGVAAGAPTGPGAIATGIVGGFSAGAASLPIALPVLQLTYQYEQIRGGIFNELSQAKDEKGVPLNIPDNTKRTYATGAGILSGAFDAYGLGKVIKGVPLVEKMMKKGMLGTVVKNAALRAAGKKVNETVAEKTLGDIIKNLGEIALVEGSTEMIQTLIEQASKSGAETFNSIKNDTDFLQGLSNLASSYSKDTKTLVNTGKLTGNLREAVLSGGIGVVAGPATTVGLSTITKPVEIIGDRRRAKAQNRRTKLTTEVVTRLNERLSALQGVEEGIPRPYSGAQGIQAKIVIDDLVKATGNTELGKLQPAESTKLLVDIANDAGVPFVWINPDQIAEFSKDEKQANDLRKLFGKSGEKNVVIDAQVKLNTALVIEFTRKYPEASGMFSFTPDSLSANEFNAKVESAKVKQQEILNRKPKNNLSKPKPHVDDLVTIEQSQTRLTEAQIKLEDLQNQGATPEDISAQEAIIADIKDRAELLPNEGEDPADFSTQFETKMMREAQDIDISPESTDEEIVNSFDSREQAEAYLDKLGDTEAVVDTAPIPSLPADNVEVYHGTRIDFDELDYNKSGGMVHFADDTVEADNYANGGGGGRPNFNEKNMTAFDRYNDLEFEYDEASDTWTSKDSEEVIRNDKMKDMLTDQENDRFEARSKDARIIKQTIDKNKRLDTTTKEGLEKFIEIVRPTTNYTKQFIENAKLELKSMEEYGEYAKRLFGGDFWRTTKRATRNSEVNADLKELVNQLKAAGYESIYFNDDNHKTTAVFDKTPAQAKVAPAPTLKERIKSLLPSLPSELSSVTDLAGDIITGEDVYGVKAFNEQNVLPPELSNIPHAKSIEDMNKKANTDYSNAVMDKAEADWVKKLSAEEQVALTVERDLERERLRSDPNIQVVENFENSKNLDDRVRDTMGGTKKKNYPAFAIDPDTLTESQREKYLTNERLVKRKLFVKGGLSANETASILGVTNGETFLDLMANTPSMNEAIDANLESKAAEIVNQKATDLDFDKSKIKKSLDDKIKVAKNALNYFKNGDWGGFKKAIKAVAKKMPNIQAIRSRAESDIRSTPIKDLDVRPYKKGEARSKDKSIDAALKGDLSTAFDHKLNEIENIEHMRATHKAVGEVNKRTKVVAKFFTPQVRAILERAGPKYAGAVKDIMESFNLSPYPSKENSQGAYEALAKDMAEKGQGDLALPADVVADMDTRQSWDSLTVEEYSFLVDSMDNILSLAKQKNKTIQSYTENYEDSMVSVLEEAVTLELSNHPDRDASRSEKELDETIGDVAENAITGAESLISNTNFAAQHLDQGKDKGFFQRLIVDRIQGVGLFNGPWGNKARNAMRADVRKAFQTAIKEYGVVKFLNLGSQKVKVPQFKGISSLNNGNLTKLDLLVMATYMGNEGNADRMTNFGLSEEVIMEVLADHLGVEEMTFVQNGVWDIYASFEDRVVALEKMDYENVELVKPRPFEFKGKEFKGGYAPIQYAIRPTEDTGKLQRIKDMFNKKEDGYSANLAARGMTAKGYTELRTGSDRVPSLNAATIALGFEEHITDITMRVPIRDAAKILGNRKIKAEIVNVIGKNKYKMMIDGVASQSTTDSARQLNNMIQGEAMMDRFFTRLESAEAINTLAGNISSIMIQPLSLGTAIENMGGIKAVPGLLSTVATMTAPWNWGKIPGMYRLAADLNPSIENARQNIEDNNIAGVIDLLPTRRVTGGKPVNMVATAKNKMINVLMSAFSHADVMLKVPVTLAAYRQYMQGLAPGQDGYAFWKMTLSERRTAAESYVTKISESSLTHGDEFSKSNLQKTTLGKRFARYFNDLRAQLNTTITSARRTKWDFKEAGKLASEGDFLGAAQAYHSVFDRTISMVMVSLAMAAYEQMIRGKFKEDDEEGMSVISLIYAALKARTFGAAPLARDLTFSAETGFKPGIPISRAGENMVSAVSGLGTILNNYTGILDDTTMDAELTDKQVKGMLNTTGYLVGGLPINGPWKLMKAVTDEDAKNVDAEKMTIGLIGAFVEKAKEFIQKFQGDEKMEPIVEQVEKDVAAFDLPTKPESFEISKLDLEAFRFAENPDGIWNQRNKEKSGAFGHYQILPSTWKFIYKNAPSSLGLTEDGLYDRDGKQAEAGIKWYIQDNARILAKNGVEPTLYNIYGAHHFGAAGWLRALRSNGSDPTSKGFSERSIKGNTWLTKMRNVGEAREFLNAYISKAKYKALLKARQTNALEKLASVN